MSTSRRSPTPISGRCPLAMLDAMNRLKLYGHHDLAEHRRRFPEDSILRSYMRRFGSSEGIDPCSFARHLGLPVNLKTSDWSLSGSGGLGPQRELQPVARSYHWIATELLGESKNESWDARDYTGRKLMRWAKRIDGPPALLDAN